MVYNSLIYVIRYCINMAETYHAYCTIRNKTEYRMSLDKIDLKYGKWVTPPKTIETNSIGNFDSQGKAFTPSGTEAVVSWIMQNKENKPTITIHYDNPAIGFNVVNITCSDPEIPISSEPTPSGHTPRFNFIIG